MELCATSTSDMMPVRVSRTKETFFRDCSIAQFLHERGGRLFKVFLFTGDSLFEGEVLIRRFKCFVGSNVRASRTIGSKTLGYRLVF